MINTVLSGLIEAEQIVEKPRRYSPIQARLSAMKHCSGRALWFRRALAFRS
jgi:hypothetical protein